MFNGLWYLLFRLASGDLEITSHDMDGRPLTMETCIIAGKAKVMLEEQRGVKRGTFLCSAEYPLTKRENRPWTPNKRPQ